MVNIRIGKAQRCRNEYSIFISFDFDMAIVNIIRSYSSRYWNKDTKEWEMPLRDLDYLQCDLKGYKLTIKDERVNTKENNKSSCIEPKNTIESVLANYQFKTNPFQHQIDGLRYGLEHDKWLLGDEQGLGKTKQIIDLACIKKKENGYKHCLIICGVNGLKWNWKEEISKHSNETGYIIGERVNKRNKVIIKGNKEKVEDLRNIDKIDSYFLITNVESLRNADINNELLKLCRNNKIDMIAADEIHKCFDYNSLVTTDKGLLKIGDIVTNKMEIKVKSFNEETQEFEWKSITNWFENPIAEKMMELSIETSNGIKTIKCTENHKFYTTNRGWVEAKDLNEFDNLVECML